jgi:hypothetical protein
LGPKHPQSCLRPFTGYVASRGVGKIWERLIVEDIITIGFILAVAYLVYHYLDKYVFH